MSESIEERISQIKKRMDEASPGPWKNECCNGLCPAGVFAGTGDHPVFHVVRGKWGDEYDTIEFEDGTKKGVCNEFQKYDKPLRSCMNMIEYGEISDTLAKANSDFISHARMDIPFLLEEITALKEKLARAVPLLKKCEWVESEYDGCAYRYCPSCSAQDGPGDSGDGKHREDCELVNLVKELEGGAES